ncbi:30S ribosomal protein S12 methylthiotransferase RimO [Petroclostridium sp. X23]|uniref:30S ribosomal protein S12 methylthiotransferase RimO n=1 Tax=Petroclostridium sp. X23 TaxID=3045146 RepID=UPI0024ACB403|nr:30S ribosomal protein S12 methylthiotransferase RimO [Petroclostridium sp. X23]WHH59402.1 30S ribosomal protein S12 methylthiotransferase RimO [Petroclostridium sp. X23]
MKYRIGVVSLGCAKNLVDTEVMLGLLSKEGFTITNRADSAHILIVNTCGFIESAKQESIDNILDLAGYKETGNCKLLIVTGCLAERYQDEIIKEIPEVDAVIGTGNYHEIADVINETFKGQKVLKYGNQDFTPEEGLPRLQSTPSYTAYLKISDGCDNFCTYCIIPKLRGKYRSRTIENIVAEAKQLSEQGVKELIIIAQDTTRYGIDLYGEHKLHQLLNELCEIDGVKWIRLHYCYPEDITDQLIDVIANQPKVCNYLDIPIQHCSNEILKKMGRRGTKEQLTALLDKIRTRISSVTLRTSIIVGFPGEKEKHFAELEEFIQVVKFDRAGVFKYSQEEDTPAASFEGQLNDEEKQERYERLMVLQNSISQEINDSKVGKIYDVLVEGYDKRARHYYGRTYADSLDIDGKAFFTSNIKLNPGDFAQVKITQAKNYDLIGESYNESCK